MEMTQPMDEGAASMEDLHEDVLLKVFNFVEDAGDLARAMCVCKAWRHVATRVQFVCAVIENVSPSYEAKVAAIGERLKNFKNLVKAQVTIGRPKTDGDDTLRRCMRYAEIGVAVDKFLFLAAKTGESNVFYGADNPVPDDLMETATSLETGTSSLPSEELNSLSTIPTRTARLPVHLPLKHVMGPADHSLRMMMPVIVFAIIRGFDDLLQVLPPLAKELPCLENLLVIDLSDNLTLNIRQHHMEQMRSLPAKYAAALRRLTEDIIDNAIPQDQDNALFADSRNNRGNNSPEAIFNSPQGTILDSSESPTTEAGAALNDTASLPQTPAFPEAVAQDDANTSADNYLATVTDHQAIINGRQTMGDGQAPQESTSEARDRRRATALEMSRSSDLDISFWRADEATVGPWKVREISVCIASHGAVPLSREELDSLARTAFGGYLLESTINFVNDQRGGSFL